MSGKSRKNGKSDGDPPESEAGMHPASLLTSEPAPGNEAPKGMMPRMHTTERASGMERASSQAEEDMFPASSPMAEPIPDEEIPSGMKPAAALTMGMAGKQAGGAINGELVSGGVAEETESEPARFPPANLPPDTSVSPQWEPGTIEVEFHDDVRPEVYAPAGGTSEFRSSTGADLDAFNTILQQYGVEKVEPTFDTPPLEADLLQADARDQGIELPNLNAFVTLHFPPTANVADIAAQLNRLPDVERAVPVPKAIPPDTPLNEPLVGTKDTVVTDPATGMENQWYIYRTRANNAWSMSSGANVVIADIDWGYRTTHQDLASRLDLTHAYNAYDGSGDVSHGGSRSHGTAVMGIAGAADNDLGMTGYAFNATLWPIQADSGTGTSLGGNAWARAIEWVRTANSGGRRKVIILEVQTGSYGNYEMVPSVNAAIRTAIASGVVVCVAAGNGNRDAGVDDAGNPIQDTGSILVGATEYDASQNRRAWFSNYSDRITVCAPGDSSHDLTCSSDGDNAYRNGFGGTSGATPKVAGTVALMLAVNPMLTHAEVRSILRNTGGGVVTDATKPVGSLVNTEAAVREASRTAVGRLELFVRGGGAVVYHNWQTAPNNGWSGWASMGGWVDRLAVSRNADGRLEVFARGGNGAVWHNWQTAPNNGWSGWASMGGWVDMVKVGQNSDGRLELFVRGRDGAVYHNWQTAPNNGWSGWASMGGWVDRLVVGRNADGRLEVFARGRDGAVYHNWQTAPNNGWSGWASMGGWVDMIEIGQNADGRLELFVRGGGAVVYHNWQTAPNNGWSGWASMGGWVDRLAVGRNADGRLEVFARGSDGAVYHNWQTAPNNGWSGWASLGGWVDLLTVSRNADGRLEVFARGGNGAVWHNWQTAPSNGWSGWTSMGGWVDMIEVGQNATG